MRLQGVGGDVTDAVLKGRSAALGVETRAGIGAGRTLREAELRLSTEDREWRFTLVADTLDWKSVKLPTQLDKEDEPVLLDDPDGKKKRPKKKRPELEIDPLTERMELLAQLDLHMTTVFQSFLSERTRPAWTRSTVPALRDWLVEGIAVE